MRSRQTAEEALCLNSRRLIEQAEVKHLADYGIHTLSFQDLVDKGYLHEVPQCPAKGVYAWVPVDPASSSYQTKVGCSVHGVEKIPDSPETIEFFSGGLRIRQNSQGNDYVQEYASSGLYRSGYLPIEPGLNYSLDAGKWDTWEDHPRHPRVYFFDQDENYISYDAAFGAFQSPAAAKFLRIRVGTAEGETLGPLFVVEIE